MSPSLKNIALRIAYDGTPYWGWQKTRSGPSIEGVLEEVLYRLLQIPTPLQAASRTDRGVHAEGQWVNFFTTSSRYSSEEWVKRLNALLPPTIRVLEAHEMPLAFHPTQDAVGKEYRYQICYAPILLPALRNQYWHLPGSLDVMAMEKAAHLLQGEHDFSAFCTFRKGLCYPHKRRHIFSCKLTVASPHHLAIYVQGNHFLYKMVRTLAGTLAAVGRHKISPEKVMPILEEGKRAGAGVTAPPHGLTLLRVFYTQGGPLSAISETAR